MITGLVLTEIFQIIKQTLHNSCVRSLSLPFMRRMEYFPIFENLYDVIRHIYSHIVPPTVLLEFLNHLPWR